MSKEHDIASVTIPAKPEYVGIARLIIAAHAGLLGIDGEATEDIKIAVSEACTTAILLIHRQSATDAKDIEVRSYDDNGALIIEVSFSSRDAVALKSVHAQLNERDLGMSLLTSIMDKVEIKKARDHDIVLHLTKNLPVH